MFHQLKDDPEFQEFLSAHTSRSKKGVWSDDTAVMATTTREGDNKETETSDSASVDSGSETDQSEGEEEAESEEDIGKTPGKGGKKSNDRKQKALYVHSRLYIQNV